MAQKKIAIVIENAFGYAGTENMCNFMSECLGKDNEVTIYSLKGQGPAFYPFKRVVNIVSLHSSRFKIPSLIKQLKYENYDVIFLISMGKLSVYFYFFAPKRFIKNKVISCEHVSLHSFSKLKRIVKVASLKAYKKVVVLTKRDLSCMVANDINAVQISNPLHYNNFERREYGCNFVAIGRLEKQKGYDRMLRIWGKFKKENPKAQLFIAGEGSMMNPLQQLARDLKIDSSVHFLGQIKNVDELYKKYDVLIMTSYYEGMPLALLEAKSWAMPVIAFNCPTGPQEIITDGVDGFLIDDGDCNTFIHKMQAMNDSNIYYNLSKNTKQTAINFSKEKVNEEWKRLIKLSLNEGHND
ncbi:glycosyltransferase [Siccibacter turicensis]|uniref:glycosyltransferase n=1 Tax=Siccibacter turicensis TaxID=357233 RepID=UPI002A6A63DE|nr:glycosyltransferase [Siccibacter turicensis]MDY0973032.1 glycosyltransferase [Siccibacter turicensis]